MTEIMRINVPSGSHVWVKDGGVVGDDRWTSGVEAIECGYGATKEEAIKSLVRSMKEDFFYPIDWKLDSLYIEFVLDQLIKEKA